MMLFQKNLQTHLCVWLSLYKMRVNRCTLLFSVLHLSLRLPLSPSSAFSPSTCFPPLHSHALSPVTRALPHSLRHSLQLFMSRLNRRRLLFIIGSFLLALPLHHSLISLPHFQCPAHSAAHSNRSLCPHHESFMDQCLFSVLIDSAESRPQTVCRGEAALLDSSRE